MTKLALDTSKLLGFRIGHSGSSRTGIKLGDVKEGTVKAT